MDCQISVFRFKRSFPLFTLFSLPWSVNREALNGRGLSTYDHLLPAHGNPGEVIDHMDVCLFAFRSLCVPLCCAARTLRSLSQEPI